jgi:hypothetical protein
LILQAVNSESTLQAYTFVVLLKSRLAGLIGNLQSSKIMGDGIGGPVIGCLTGNAFEMAVTHFRKDNKDEYGKTERIVIAKVDNPGNPQYQEKTLTELEQALKGKFVTCNVQYRDKKTDVLVCNVFVQNPPEGF